MAMVASAVANGGKLMTPGWSARWSTRTARPSSTIQPKLYRPVMKPATAREIAQMMTDVVEEGTGTPAQLDGIHVRGQDGHAPRSARPGRT